MSAKVTSELNRMGRVALREYFIKLTDHVKLKNIGYLEQARIAESQGSNLNETRMRNIRKDASPTIYPLVTEVSDFQRIFAKELADFREDGPEPSELEQKVIELQKDVQELKELVKKRDNAKAIAQEAIEEYEKRKKR